VPAPFGALSPWAERDTDADEVSPEKSLFEKYNESLQEQHNKPKRSLITKGLVREGNALKSPEAYTQPFCDFLTENPTVWHAVSYFEKKLEKAGFRKVWSLGLNWGHG
jgi:aminopeptidase I